MTGEGAKSLGLVLDTLQIRVLLGERQNGVTLPPWVATAPANIIFETLEPTEWAKVEALTKPEIRIFCSAVWHISPSMPCRRYTQTMSPNGSASAWPVNRKGRQWHAPGWSRAAGCKPGLAWRRALERRAERRWVAS